MNDRAKRPETAARAVVGAALTHDSALKHATGEAIYVDDIPEPPGTLHLHVGLSGEAHADVARLDLDATRAAPGVVAVLTAADIPGVNDVGPVRADDPIFAEGVVEYAGQALFAVAAETLAEARAAAKRAVVEYAPREAILAIEDALAKESYIEPPRTFRRGDAEAALARAPHRLSGEIRIGGQDHFYLEGQVALAIPMEDGDMLVQSSTQHPSEVQHLVARMLGRPDNAVTVEVRRMGGAFGGKETQAAAFACIAALAAHRTKRPAKLRPDRDDDMRMTGKRHDFLARYEVGFDETGRILGAEIMLAGRCGRSADLSMAINDRAMFHADNAYFLENAAIRSYRCRTHTVSNTAFRGFGGPQGMMAIEAAIDDIARRLGRDPAEVRRRNLYGAAPRNVTPYHMTVEDGDLLAMLFDRIETSASYRGRRAEITAFNARNPVIKRGIALTPVKFGISFTTPHLNQAGALVHVYADGSVQLNHGGTEMGQGLFVKVAQVVAETFGIAVERVKITATSTGKVPNTSPTAASSGSDLNGKAAEAAARTIRDRLAAFAAERFGVDPAEVAFAGGRVRAGATEIAFDELVGLAYLGRVSLSATGFYRTPKIHFDRAAGRGRPFFYFACGAAVSEVALDTLTGEYRLLRVDLLHDVGRSINPAVDRGQIEGGFVKGMGWLTTEELWWDRRGRLRTHAPSTYKIPVMSDVPEDFRVTILEGSANREETIYRSKAVGEPPLMLALSVFHALRDAIASVGRGPIALDAPATPERVLMALEARA